ncbi:MAG TPA: phosphate ABC transporter substrate-binding protein PstS [Micropepsaceae bacterium]|jgi:phosphate transport system substrate-binding protein
MRLYFSFPASILAGVIAVGLATDVSAADISGAGSTFAFPIYGKWAAAYQMVSGSRLNYQSIGSGGGIKQIESKTVTFGATDMPLPTKELDQYGLIQFPTVIGGVVPVVNIAGVKSGDVVLDGPTLADIYLGKIKTWNAAAIKKLNPTVNLPNQAIVVIHRSDASGTVYIFTNYLSKVSAEWKDHVGNATGVDWPAGIGAKGSEGVAGNVMQSNGAIGFVEYAYAKQNNLSYTRMLNHDGKAVSPVAAAFAAAASGAAWNPADGFATMLTDQAGQGSWPISGATWVLFYKNPPDKAATAEGLKFFQWSFKNGDQIAAGLDYVPFPTAVKDKIESSWTQVQGWSAR